MVAICSSLTLTAISMRRIYNERTGLNPEIELFDLDIRKLSCLIDSPYETTNVSETYPELIMRAKQIMAQSRTRSFIDAWNF